jgi:predicted DNA-binding mobile mystery protein A
MRSVARASLDQRFAGVEVEALARPPQGWLATIRQALGMSARELGERMHVSSQQVSAFERREAEGSIRLDSLERAARAMHCRLVYALVPDEPLEDMVWDQARRQAAATVLGVRHNMRLEDQDVSDRVAAAQIEDLADDLIDRRGLWTDRDA